MDKNIVDQIIQAIMSFLGKNVAAEIAKPVQPILVQDVPAPVEAAPAIDWSDPKAKITDRISVGEALTLQSWGVMHVPSEDEKAAIIGIAIAAGKAIDVLEKIIGRHASINIHAFIRPEKANCPNSKWNGYDYNRYIYETQVWKDLSEEEKAKKTVPKSPHRTGHAIDFHIGGYEGAEKCAQIRQMLLPHLEELGLRMEDLNGGWVHLDNLPVVHARFFKP